MKRVTAGVLSVGLMSLLAFGTQLCRARPEPKMTTDPPSAEAVPPGPITATTPVAIPTEPGAELQNAIRAIADGDKETTLRLTFVGMTPPAIRASVRVYLNADPRRPLPDTEAPQFVGSFSFYGTTGSKTPYDMMVGLNATILRLNQAGKLRMGDPLVVSAIAVPFEEKADKVEIKVPFQRLRLSAHRTPSR
ncbi:MAG TPA: hypothetical protein VGF55_17370 [Gemmataceae bacterium]|jgi:hypothetical protein